MDMTFAFLEGYEGLTVTQPAKEETEPAPKPECPPPCWDERRIDADACRRATKAMCGQGR